ncbi:MAG: hypothetical protein MUE40_13835 [Anaerolineae bacterium]|nr:hypothetical protein [Anaerolineae bacterium]
MTPAPTTAHITIEQDNADPTLVILHFYGDWSWHECRDVMQTALYMQEMTEIPFGYIYDLSESRLASRALMEHMKKLLQLVISPAPRGIVIVDKGTKLQMMVDLLARLYPQKMPDTLYFAENLSRARTLIAR